MGDATSFDMKALSVALMMCLIVGSSSGYIVGQYQIAEYKDEALHQHTEFRKVMHNYTQLREICFELKNQLENLRIELAETKGEYEALQFSYAELEEEYYDLNSKYLDLIKALQESR